MPTATHQPDAERLSPEARRRNARFRKTLAARAASGDPHALFMQHALAKRAAARAAR